MDNKDERHHNNRGMLSEGLVLRTVHLLVMACLVQLLCKKTRYLNNIEKIAISIWISHLTILVVRWQHGSQICVETYFVRYKKK